MHVCKNCLKDGTGFERCSKCKCVRYCSRECQRAHWKRSHKKVCAHLAANAITAEEAHAMAEEGQHAVGIKGYQPPDGDSEGGGGGDDGNVDEAAAPPTPPTGGTMRGSYSSWAERNRCSRSGRPSW